MEADVELGEGSPETDSLTSVVDQLLSRLPGLAEHGCSGDQAASFLPALRRGTSLPHLVEHVARELQKLAGDDVPVGLTVRSEPGRFHVVVGMRTASVGIAALRTAVEVVEAVLDRRPPRVRQAVDRLRQLAERDGLGPSTRAIVDAAERRGIPVVLGAEDHVIRLGQGIRAHEFSATITDRTSLIASGRCRDKARTNRVLERAGLPVPPWAEPRTIVEALDALRALRLPVVVKPLDGNHGRGVTLGVDGDEAMREAFALAQSAARGGRVLVQSQAEGRDVRVLVVAGRMVACAERLPASVTGDGRRTLQRLVEAANRDPRRGTGHGRPLTRISLDSAAEQVLRKQGLTPSDIPAVGQVVRIADTANLSTGGTSVDRTDVVHSDVARTAEAAAALLGLDVAGIDLVTPDITRPLREVGGAVIEVNAAPGLRMHLAPSEGSSRDVGVPIVNSLFPEGELGRIPIAAITGTNGKTTTVRMLTAVLRADGRTVGATTTDGLEIDGWTMKRGDLAGPDSARLLLGMPIDTAVLEVARGGILRDGLGYDQNDVAVVTNLTGDHLGLGGVNTIAELARVKRVIVAAVPSHGTAVLNADDPAVASMADVCRGRVLWVSTAPPSGAVLRSRGSGARLMAQAMRHGGPIARIEERDGREMLVVRDAGEAVVEVPIADVPATYAGAARCNVANALMAAAAAWALGVAPDRISAGLGAFQPTVSAAPGRLNVLEHAGRTVVIDYAHNVAAIRALGTFLERQYHGRPRVGVVSVPGDRRAEDREATGAAAGAIFDALVVADPVPRGMQPGSGPLALVRAAVGDSEGASRVREWAIVPDEVDACREAMRRSRPGDVVVMAVADGPKVAHALGLVEGQD